MRVARILADAGDRDAGGGKLCIAVANQTRLACADRREVGRIEKQDQRAVDQECIERHLAACMVGQRKVRHFVAQVQHR
jgi:hypothetical protein